MINLECPIPKFDFDVITLGHGSGGLLTHRLLQSGVFSLFSNPLLDLQHDGATLTLEGRIAVSTDSFVVSPLFFPGGNIGDLAVNGTVNDLAMCGARAKHLTLGFIIEEGLPITQLWDIMVSIRQAAHTAGVQIISGDTKVVEKGKGDGIFINTTGMGPVHPNANISHQRIQTGDKLIISGPIAAHGIAIMSLRKGLEFETTITSDTQPLCFMAEGLIENFGASVRFMRDPTRGGVASVLNEVAELTKHGFVLSQTALPIHEQVEGACEMLGLDPLYVANEGIMLAVVAPEIAEACVALLHNQYACPHAAIIGEVTTEHPGKVTIKSRIGGRRVVNFLPGEQLPRIC
jgi:hydrogenase expression/formation protein HypE